MADLDKKTWIQKGLSGIKQLGIMLLLFLVVSTAVDLWRGKDIPTQDLPHISALDLDGNLVDVMAMSQEAPVLVYFWGTWCPVCNFVSPSVDILSDYYPVVSVAMSSGSDERLAHFLDDKGYTLSTINDKQSFLAREWSVQVTPTVMVFKDGELVHYTTGFTSLPGMWWRMVFA
ncbi:protein disulfide oxidoreductase [Shewanella sp. 1_MG-2023]|uniref:protein disulfide oxidoreductase n=1 Tax=unclassified Shewanella TaxID=196818 RepID=UPI001E39618A|nr:MULTISPECIES: protein disulfide oxidoreductase [unclassified Shewanella]MCC4832696.1 protein disulfide oxidoreductase [Shewanella sp. 10N.7]MDO6612440.1 protein disulfide oxidoreductase [Shewanella sp. 7_MG-2023]MDO6772519.1 protein disulfide oxidoreductase [Shewanella sp. 2_MG-2023]MDO6794483.1 protein disulfide oxidoreductase [Shewanella sp. 1_MG-2023]